MRKKRKILRETWRHTRKVVGSSGGNTVAPAVVFHWGLERVAVLLFLSESERGVCSHMITTPRYSEVDGALLCFQDFGKSTIFFWPGLLNMPHKLNTSLMVLHAK